MWNDKKRKKQLRYFFLFNDILLLTKRESHKRYWCHSSLPITAWHVAHSSLG